MIRYQQGIGLLEALIALLLLAVGMLGFAALQTSSVKATNESIERVKVLVVMQSVAEKIRTNPAAMDEYQTQFSAMTTPTGLLAKAANAPSDMCGLDGTAPSALCTPAQIAAVDVHLFAKQFADSDITANIVDCPRNTTASVIANSRCMIAAWDTTTPTVGASGNHCLTRAGAYNPGASCMFIEVN
mgnify:FL=1